MNDSQDAQTEVSWFSGPYGAGLYWFLHSHDEDWDNGAADIMDALVDGVFEYCPEEDQVRLRARH